MGEGEGGGAEETAARAHAAQPAEPHAAQAAHQEGPCQGAPAPSEPQHAIPILLV